MSTGFLIFVALCGAYALVGWVVVRASATRVEVERVVRRKLRALTARELETLGELDPSPALPTVPSHSEKRSPLTPASPSMLPSLPAAYSTLPPVVDVGLPELVVAEVGGPAPAETAVAIGAERETPRSGARSDPELVDFMSELPAVSTAQPVAADAAPPSRASATPDEGDSTTDCTPEEPDTPASTPPSAANAGEDETEMSAENVDLPSWMEENTTPVKATKAAPPPRSRPTMREPLSSREPAAPLPSEPENDNAEPTVVYLMSPEEVAAEAGQNSSSPPPSMEPLKALTRIDQDRKRALADLEAATRALVDIEKRAGQSGAELARQIEALAKEHSQCDRVRREVESRAQGEKQRQDAEVGRLKARIQQVEATAAEVKEAKQRAETLQQELQGARKEIETGTKAREELDGRLRKQETDLNAQRTRAQAAEEQTKQATARITEIEREQEQSNLEFAQELDARTTERDGALAKLQERESTVKTLTLRCVDQEQRTVTLQNQLGQKTAENQDLAAKLAKLQQELDARTRAYESQRAVVEAAQGVMAELRPKLQILENQLTRPT